MRISKRGLNVFARLALSMTFTVSCHFALGAQRLEYEQQEKAARSYVSNNPIDDVFSYLNRAIRIDEKPSPDSPLDANLVLNFAASNPDFSTKHLHLLLELGEVRIARRSQNTEERLSLFLSFVQKGIIQHLKPTPNGVAAADELNLEVGYLFDKAWLRWSRLTARERMTYSGLLGSTAVETDNPDFSERLSKFVKNATPSEFSSFYSSLKYAAGGYVLKTVSNPQAHFLSKMRLKMNLIRNLADADEELVTLENKIRKGHGSWRISEARYAFKVVFTQGTAQFVKEALDIIESQLHTALQTSGKSPEFAELLQDREFKNLLLKLEDRMPELSRRLHDISDRSYEIENNLAELRLSKLSRDHSKMESQMRKAFGRAICKDLFIGSL